MGFLGCLPVVLLISPSPLHKPQPDTSAVKPSPHWSFQPVSRPPIPNPNVHDNKWSRNPIDRFILQRLEKENLHPSPEADRPALIRRLSLDLTGLPPSPREIDAFLADTSPTAYEKVVNRLIASPHYGEHWARKWLDVARYADTNGYEKDVERVMWKYRDWVIDALNRDMPFDQFTIEQLAGDLLPNATIGQKIATGFHRNTMINQEGGVDVEEYRWEAIHDRVATTGTVFLGLTTGCARCHDHKYDPITQRDYYRLAAFFNNAEDVQIDLATPDELKKRDNVRAEIVLLEKQIRERPSDPMKAEWAKRLEQVRASEPNIVTAMVMSERSTPRTTHIFIRGEYPKEGAAVDCGTPEFMAPMATGVKADRLALARWLVDGKNPLCARTTVNRLWQSIFGRGIIATPDDLGVRGAVPTHRELLDWLAAEFVSGGPGPDARPWSMKRIIKLMVMSATYRQSSQTSPALRLRDPDNLLLARGPRYRVDAESVRDIALSVSGLMNPAVGGPSVFPPQPEGVTGQGINAMRWNTETGPNRYRRGMYTFLKRTAPYPALILFDAPTADASCTRRNRSNTPMQALNVLNDVVFIESAQALAGRILKESKADTSDRVRYGFRLCTGRYPTLSELIPLARFSNSQLFRLKADPPRAREIAFADPKMAPEHTDVSERAALTLLARVLLNLDETMTRE